jgi:hypothetical protein
LIRRAVSKSEEEESGKIRRTISYASQSHHGYNQTVNPSISLPLCLCASISI